MEFKQPLLADGVVDGQKEPDLIALMDDTEEGLSNRCHELGASSTRGAECFFFREPDALNGSLKKEQSILDSLDSIPGTEEVEKLEEPGGEGIVMEKAMQMPVTNFPSVLSENALLPIKMHMYSRRKKGKDAGMVKDLQNIHRYEKPCLLDEQKSPALTSDSGAPHERSKLQDLHHVQKVEKDPSHCEQESHAHAACGSVNIEKSKQEFPMRKAKVALFKDKERSKQRKLAKAKCPLSPYKKRGRDTAGDCVSGQYEAFVDQFLKSSNLSELGVVAAVVEDGKHAAVRAGLRASTVISVEKARFRDVLKQPDGLREYLECRNFILGLWEKDVCRTLSITDCGLSAAASTNETSRIHLFRDIHYFLNYCGFINLGVTSKKPRLSPETEEVANPSNLGEAKGVGGFTRMDKAIAYVSPERDTISLLFGRKEVSGHAQKKRFKLEMVVHEPTDEDVRETADQRAVQNNLSKPSGHARPVFSDKAAGSELAVIKPSDEESLLDMKNRIKARNRRKKQGLPGVTTPFEVECQEEEEEVKAKEREKNMSSNLSESVDGLPSCVHDKQSPKKRVLVVGAGPAGLVAARHLQNMDIEVTILEARDRVGGRAFTDRSTFSGPVDLGASIVIGVEADLATETRPDPLALLCKQLNLELTVLQGDCPLLDVVKSGKVPADLDTVLEADFNCLLEEAAKLFADNGSAKQMSLQKGLKLAYRKKEALANIDHTAKMDQAGKRKGSSLLYSKDSPNFSLAQRVLSWHFANLELQCGAELSKISLSNWTRDNTYGGFAGPHCMIKGGFSTIMEALGTGLDIHLEQEVTEIEYSCRDEKNGGLGEIQILTKEGATYFADAVLLTVPLGCMKAGLIKFSPPLPEGKISSIKRLGLGFLNKVIMEFPVCFWDERVDSFGCTVEMAGTRGRCFLFWNLKPIVGFPILSTSIVGEAAMEDEQKEVPEVVEQALSVLRRLFGDTAVPQPTAFTVTRWGSDPYSRGSYSYIAVGASVKDYDTIGRPVENQLFFAGEATCKEHPNTVGGAMMSGLREAVRILDVLHNRSNLLSEAEAIGAAEKLSDSQADEVQEITKRLTDGGISIATKMGGGNPSRIKGLRKVGLLQGLYGVPKTNAGRLLLAKEMLQLPESYLRNLLNNKTGLAVLNSWIQGAMGNDGGQLLRLCLQLLLAIESSHSMARRSGIQMTLKDKVSKHTSRDVRSTARKLLGSWLEGKAKDKTLSDLAKPLQKPEDPDTKLLFKKKARDAKVSLSQAKAQQRDNSSVSGRDVLQAVSKREIQAPEPLIKKKVRVVKVSVSQAGAELRENPLAFGSSIVRGVSERQTQASGCLSAEVTAQVALGEELVTGPKDLGQALESTMPVSEATPIVTKVIHVAAKAQDSGPANVKQPELPKIMSFQKFAKRDQIDVSKRRPLQRETLLLYGKDLVTSGADARHSKVRDWSIDFSDSCGYLGSPRLLAMLDNASSRDGFSAVIPSVPCISSTEIAGERHESGLTSNQDEAALPTSKEATDDASAGSSSRGSQRRQSGVCLASLNSGNTPLNSAPSNEDDRPAELLSPNIDAMKLEISISNHPSADADKRDSQSHSTEKRPDSAEARCCSLNEVNAASAGSSVRLAAGQQIETQITLEGSPGHLLLDGGKSYLSTGGLSKSMILENQHPMPDTSEQVKKTVTDYVAHLLTPLYKTKRISKESFKSIMKKAIVKVMERRTEEELVMEPTEFMDTKRKIKIRSLVDKLVERYLESVHKQ